MDLGSLLVPIFRSSFKAYPVKKSITLLNGPFYRCYKISTIFRIFHMKEKKNVFPWCTFKNWFMLSVRISSYGCTREVWRARKKRKSCSRR